MDRSTAAARLMVAVKGLTEFLPISSTGHLILLGEAYPVSTRANGGIAPGSSRDGLLRQPPAGATWPHVKSESPAASGPPARRPGVPGPD